MENRRAIIISVVCITVSLCLIWAFVSVRTSEMTAEFGVESDVVVAAENIPEYSVIRPEMVETRRIFKNFRQPQTVSDANIIVGKAAYVPIYRDEQISLTKLINQDGRPVLDRQVERKMRAITVQISPQTGVGRLIRPGNRVDIMTTPNYEQGGTTVFEVKTVVQNVLVLATGKNIQNAVPTRVTREVLAAVEDEFEVRKRKDLNAGNIESLPTSRPDDNYTSLTLQLTPEDAEKVLYMTHSYGDQRLYYTLRNSADQAIAKLDTTILDDILGPESDYGALKKKPPPAPPPRPPRFNDFMGTQAIPRY